MRAAYGDERRTEIVDEGDERAHRGPDRRRGHGDHDLEPGLHQAQRGHALPDQRRGGKGVNAHGDQGGGLRRAALHRLHARLHALLLHARAALLAQGVRDPAGRPRRQGQGDRQPAAAAGEREDLRGDAGARVRREPLHRHGDRPGRGQEDRALGLRQPARRRDHRDQPRRGRRADRGAHHRRQAPALPGHRAGQGRALRRERHPDDGPGRPRRHRHPLQGRRPGRGHGGRRPAARRSSP